MVSMWIALAASMIALLTGLWIGRGIRFMAEETEEQARVSGEEKGEEEIKKREKKIQLGWVVASPIAGFVRPIYEGNRLGALIQPQEERVYAPVSGRIVKLYPMGQAMLIAADFGEDILLRVGNGGDEMCSIYYRSRVVQNEIIAKGKLLLEFDRAGLENQGVDVTITVTWENSLEAANGVITSREFVRTGEDLLWG